ncbi:MAG: N-acetylglucosamine-specific PTS transporter subunit IIBC [Gammaproteobacteria bacterium]|nr:N-acetylglucosamine-specific PTS transporter subunit IIBC [Gammaproteobacteria bacterium]
MWNRFLASLQPLGRALMLPIAVLPIAGMLLRLGQPDLFDIAWIAAAGNAVFANLGLVFAIGVAVGLAEENHGAAGLAAVVGYLVTTHGAEALLQVPPSTLAGLTAPLRALADEAYRSQAIAKLSVPIGILSGLIAGFLYNRFRNVRLPSYLAFFAGRRFVPIAAGAVGMLLAGVFGWSWPILEHGMDALSRAVLGSGYLGLFAYGVLNRVLIVTGLHHILNNIAWFLLGDYHGVTGDLNRFFAGDPSAGAFMSGFFPVMMFGLPAACLAMYRTARPERRAAVAGLLASIALTSFLTGVTEPIEFTFMFLAPSLYALHALLTGTAMVLMRLAGVHLGFTFSAGLFDYLLNYGRATRPWLLLPIGLGYFALYYGLFHFFIVRFDLRTPGREPVDPTAAPAPRAPVDGASRAEGFVAALGGPANLASVAACTTRLRLRLSDPTLIDRDALRALGASGTLVLAAGSVQVVVGPIADQVAGEIRAALAGRVASASAPDVNDPSTPNSVPPPADFDAGATLAALGGRANAQSIEAIAGRVLLVLHNDAIVDLEALHRQFERGVATPAPGRWHLLVGAAAPAVAARLSGV